MSLLEALQSILGTAGNVLDTPGSVARGLFAGDPGAAFGGVFDPSQRISGRDMLERWGALGPNEEGLDFGDALGFGAELLTDPMNLVMPLAGKALAGKALARGPMYEKGLATVKGAGVPLERLDEVLQLPIPALRELPPGSTYLGHGAEATAFKTPMGDVARFEYLPARRKEIDQIPISPDVLQPNRDVFYDFPKEIMIDGGPVKIGGVRVQRMPFAEGVGTMDINAIQELQGRLKNQGIDFFDAHKNNAGMYQGRPVVVDPGATAGLSTPGQTPWAQTPSLLDLTPQTIAERLPPPQFAPGQARGPITAQRPGALMERLMDMLGYTGYTRQLAAGQDAMNPMMYGIAGYNAARPLSAIQQGGYPGLGNSLPMDEFPGDKWWPSTAPGNFM